MAHNCLHQRYTGNNENSERKKNKKKGKMKKRKKRKKVESYWCLNLNKWPFN